MHLTKFMLILICCAGLGEAGFMDRFKPSYNWIPKVDYKFNLWSTAKKENPANTETNSTVAVNQTGTSVLPSTTSHPTESTLITNRIEPTSSPTTVASDLGNSTGSSTISNQTEASMPTAPPNQINSEQTNWTVSNLAFSTANSLPPIDSENKPAEATTRPAEPAQLHTTTSETPISLEDDSQTKLNNFTTPTNSLETFTEPTHLLSSTDSTNRTNGADPTGNVSLTTIAPTESHSSAFDETSTSMKPATEPVAHSDADRSEQKAPTPDHSLQTTLTTLLANKATKPPVEQFVEPFSTATVTLKETDHEANHSAEQTSTEGILSPSSTAAPARAGKVTQTKQPVSVRVRESTTPSTIKTTRRPINKPNTPIIVKFLNLRKLTPGSKTVMKNKEGENDNIIYRDIRTYNFVLEKLDEAFVKFINTFYYNSNRRV